MDLTTRCPQCGTVFQASLSDLQLRKGYIRCVQCSHIFDGYAEVVSDASDAAAPFIPPPATQDPTPNSAADASPLSIDAAEYAAAPQVFRSGRSMVEPDTEPTIGYGDFRAEPPIQDPNRPAPFVVEARPGRISQGGTAAPLLRQNEAPSWWSGVLRLLARLLLLVLIGLLGGQLLYVYRAQLAQAIPATRPWLEQACVPLRCQVPYARDLARLVITGSALKIQDDLPNARASGADSAASPSPQRFILQATLRNQSEHAQEWPTLVLDLKDAAGTLLVRRNVAPGEYLGAELAQRPFAARAEVLIQVPLTLDGLRINGYQLDLFYP
ncbi:MAG: zinc-ribbon and DUF3426 domain-containing protein [Castellaniella sp.]|uniref:zinc-ribbon and DUF3426 domain-containing protein n=1 Tax=Castellaniella sp. TaxID=1955812 RepID=UPI003C723CDE